MNLLRGVIDPELGSDIVELGMAKGAEVDADGTVHVRVGLTTAGCPLRAQIQRDIKARIENLPAVTRVHIDWTELTQEEKATAMAKARWNKAQDAPVTAVPATTRVIMVASGKGGVGKSSISANIAAGLAHNAAERFQGIEMLRVERQHMAEIGHGVLDALFGKIQPGAPVPHFGGVGGQFRGGFQQLSAHIGIAAKRRLGVAVQQQIDGGAAGLPPQLADIGADGGGLQVVGRFGEFVVERRQRLLALFGRLDRIDRGWRLDTAAVPSGRRIGGFGGNSGQRRKRQQPAGKEPNGQGVV